ncbi:hypothetical protein VPH35_060608 [Triticum aestivum]|uniref:MATH domain-containing protein n=1 Tax=Triticum aestivum TaxID=4565 RepID=A0A3B6GV28_WHEAT
MRLRLLRAPYEHVFWEFLFVANQSVGNDAGNAAASRSTAAGTGDRGSTAGGAGNSGGAGSIVAGPGDRGSAAAALAVRRGPAGSEDDAVIQASLLVPIRWRIQFSDDHKIGSGRDGFLYYHAASRWTTVRDRDHDILAGRYLDVDEQIQAGACFAIDDFQIVVRECVQESSPVEESIELVDLASDSENAAPKPNIGGRFWVLADDTDADEEGEGGCILSDKTEPNAIISGMVRDLSKGLQVKKALDQKTEGHGKSSSTKIKPWKGPIPKVIFRATAVIRSWSLLTPMEAREHLVTGSIRWEMVARDIFNRFGWRSCNRIGN